MHLSGVIYAVEILVAFGLAIFIHELGHFIAAKRAGIKVERFSLGFGPKLWGFVRGETEFVIGVIPIGGYVKMLGEENKTSAAVDPRSFSAQSHGARAVVIIMGVAMNMILGFVLFVAAFTFGVSVETSVVGSVKPGSPSWEAGLRAGDRIVGLNGVQELDWWAIRQEVATSDAGSEIILDVRKADTDEPAQLSVRPEVNPQVGLQVLQVWHRMLISVGSVAEGTPAETAGLKKGDLFISVNGHRIQSIGEFLYLIKASGGKPITLELERDGRPLTVVVTPRRVPRWTFGIRPTATAIVGETPPGSALAEAGLAPNDRILSVDGKPACGYLSLRDLLNQSASTTVDVVVARGDELIDAQLRLERPAGSGGVYLGELTCPMTIGAVDEGSPAALAGVKPGMTLTAVVQTEGSHSKDKRPQPVVIASWEDFDSLQQQVGLDEGHDEDLLFLALELQGPAGQRFATPPMRPIPDQSRPIYQIGIVPYVQSETELRRYGFLKAGTMGARDAVLWTKRIVGTLGRLVSGGLRRDAISGPVGIWVMSAKIAESGVTKLAYWFAIININLAILNLLPLPILDGGALLLLLIEKLKRRPLNERAVEIAHIVSWVLILALLLFVTSNDIARFFF